MTFGYIQQKLLRFKCQCVLYIGRKMSFKQRAAIDFCVKLGKTFTETHQMLQNAYGDDCLSRTQVYEWFGRFKSGRETLDDDERSGRPRTGLSKENIEKVREFIKNNKKSSVKVIEMELGIPQTTAYRILTEVLGLKKVNSRFVPHKLTEDQKVDRIEHCKDIVKSARKDQNFLKSIVTGDETWCFEYEPETKRQSAEWRAPDEGTPKKSRLVKSKVKVMLICFYDSKGIIHKEFVPPGQTVTGEFYLGVMKRLLARIRRIRPEYREIGSWSLLHDNAPSHRSRLVTEFLVKNHVIPLHHSPYSPDLAPCDFYLFPKLHLAMKGKWHASIEAIEKATTDVLKTIPIKDMEKSFDNLLERANLCIDAEGVYID